MSPTTVFLGKLLGLYLIAISIGMLVSRRRTLESLDEMARSGPWMLFSGMVATAAGLAVVIAHNVWSGGALAVAVTIAGWAALLKGLVLLDGPGEQGGLGLQSNRIPAIFLCVDRRRAGVGALDHSRRIRWLRMPRATAPRPNEERSLWRDEYIRQASHRALSLLPTSRRLLLRRGIFPEKEREDRREDEQRRRDPKDVV